MKGGGGGHLALENPALSSIMDHWGLHCRNWKKVKDVYKIQTESGCKNLKVSPHAPERLAFVHQAVTHLNLNGFKRLNPIIPTLDGRTYVTDGTVAYTLFDWVEGGQCDFRNLSVLAEATKVLAEFHQKSRGFTPPDHSNMRNRLGRCLNHFEEYYQNLIDFTEQAREMPRDPFARVYLKNVDSFLPLAARATELLRQSPYQELTRAAQESMVFCHGDPAARNFILTPGQGIFMIDFDSCRLDLPLMDLIKFSRRVLKKYHWDFRIARIIIEAYHEVSPLTSAELEVMRAVFYFPQKFWRISIRYFHDHRHHTPEREFRKFQKYLSNKTAIYRFHKDFDAYFSDSVRDGTADVLKR